MAKGTVVNVLGALVLPFLIFGVGVWARHDVPSLGITGRS
jgi:hypothetical protein